MRGPKTPSDINLYRPLPRSATNLALPTSLNITGIPEGVAITLQHILAQLEVLTKTMAMLEERLSLCEDRIGSVESTQQVSQSSLQELYAAVNNLAGHVGV